MTTRTAFLTLLALAVFSIAAGFPETPDLSGQWAGPITTSLSGSGGLEVTLIREGQEWKASIKLRIGGQEIAPAVDGLKIDGASVSFATAIDRTRIKFAGKIDGDKLGGTLEAFQDDRKISDGTFTLTRGGQMPALQQAGGIRSRIQLLRY